MQCKSSTQPWGRSATLCARYVHAIFTALAYHLHEPLPEPLHDLGFEIFPELGESNAGVSEAFVYCGEPCCAALHRARTHGCRVVAVQGQGEGGGASSNSGAEGTAG